MNPHDPGIPHDAEPEGSTTAPETGVSGIPDPVAGRPGRLPIWAGALAAGLVAGAVGWLVGEATLDRYRISEEAAGQQFDFTQANIELRIANSQNAAIAYGLLGASLGFLMGLAGGMARGQPRAGLVGGFVGMALGGAAGGLIPFVVVPLYFDTYDPISPTLVLPMLVNGAVWVPVGVAAGLAFGLGIGGRGRIGAGLVGGLVGGVLGTAAVETINAVAFPLAQSGQFIPSAGPYVGDTFDWERFYLLRAGRSASPAGPGEKAIDHFTVETASAAARQRLIARLLIPLLIAVGVAWSTQGSTRKAPRPAT